MKCHWCHQELQQSKVEFREGWWFCPDSHVQIKIYAGNIEAYTIYWDEDIHAENRYKLDGAGRKTVMWHKKPLINALGVKSYIMGDYVKVMDIDRLLPLIIKDDVILFDNLIERLKKLKVFS